MVEKPLHHLRRPRALPFPSFYIPLRYPSQTHIIWKSTELKGLEDEEPRWQATSDVVAVLSGFSGLDEGHSQAEVTEL